ncbi:MAG: AMP-binding protein, partial [Natronomonas sp.]
MPGGTDQTLRPFLWRAANLYPDKEIVSRTHEGIERYTYSEYDDRTAQLANALEAHGIEEGDRVATFCWNHHRHFETYFAVPTIGAQLHTINPLLPDEHIQYIVDNADDQLIFVDDSLAPKLAQAAADAPEFEGVDFVVMSSTETETLDATPYEEFVDGHSTEFDWPVLDEDQAAGICYTSGTTGNPKG